MTQCNLFEFVELTLNFDDFFNLEDRKRQFFFIREKNFGFYGQNFQELGRKWSKSWF